jgi:hypothetical protein
MMSTYVSPLGISKKIGKMFSVFDLKAFVCQKPGFHAFSPAASGSCGEQLSPI